MIVEECLKATEVSCLTMIFKSSKYKIPLASPTNRIFMFTNCTHITLFYTDNSDLGNGDYSPA